MRFSSRPDRTAMSVSPFTFGVPANSMKLGHGAGLQPSLSRNESAAYRARCFFSFERANFSTFPFRRIRIGITLRNLCVLSSDGASVRT